MVVSVIRASNKTLSFTELYKLNIEISKASEGISKFDQVYHYVIQDPLNNIVRCFNTGLKKAKAVNSNYIIFLHIDTHVLPKSIPTIIQLIDNEQFVILSDGKSHSFPMFILRYDNNIEFPKLLAKDSNNKELNNILSDWISSMNKNNKILEGFITSD